jgi:hypothetical protein
MIMENCNPEIPLPSAEGVNVRVPIPMNLQSNRGEKSCKAIREQLHNNTISVN